MKEIFFLGSLFIAFIANAFLESFQTINTYKRCEYYYHEGLKKDVYTSYDQLPFYEGGIAIFLSDLNKVLKVSNDYAWEQSSVLFNLIIDEYGKIVVVEILDRRTKELKTIKEYSYVEKQVKKALCSLKNDKWSPAVCYGNKVTSSFMIYLNVHFKN